MITKRSVRAIFLAETAQREDRVLTGHRMVPVESQDFSRPLVEKRRVIEQEQFVQSENLFLL